MPNWKRVGNYHPLQYLKVKRQQILVNNGIRHTCEPASTGAALFVNTFALTKRCPFSFIFPKHH